MAAPVPTAGSSLAKVPLWARFVIGIAFAGVVGFVYWVMFFSDVSNKIEAAKNQSTALDRTLREKQLAQESYLKDKSELAMRLDTAKQLNKIAPPDTQQGAFLSYIQIAANIAGVKISSYSPEDEVQQPYFVKDPMRIEISGTYHQIARFTYEVSKQERVINLENIEITEPKVVGEELSLKAKCRATAFHTAKAKAAPGAAPPAPAPPPPGGAPK